MEFSVNILNPLTWLHSAKVFNCVHRPEVFSSILGRERDRSDRTGQEFSMAVFYVGKGNRRLHATRNLVPILTHRIRSTDSIGWLDAGRIGAVLPHTRSAGAWKFIEIVKSEYPDGHPPPDTEVYTYPTAWLPGTGGERTGTDAKPIEELKTPLMFRSPAWKRLTDIAGSLAAITLLSPLLLLVALFIKAVSPGPVFFRQVRVGLRGRLFTLWKFRTMHAGADTVVHRDHLCNLIHSEKAMTKLDRNADRRIIPFGGILRASGIDELPQLINVLRGDMSLIGPRPCIPYEAREYSPWQMRRFDVLPGLTGLWQVSGKNRTTFTEMMRLDICYAKTRNILLDIRIFLMTVPAIIDQVVERKPDVAVRHQAAPAAAWVCAAFCSIFLAQFSRK